LISQQVEGAEHCNIGQGVTFGRNAKVVGRDVSIGSGTTLGDDVVIKADVVRIGRRCNIEQDVECSWHGGHAELFSMGDCCYVGRDSRLLVRRFSVGDYAVLHNHLLANGDAELTMGNNAWVGQNGILNANQSLRMGDNVGIGAYSAVWTHGKFGALMDGCLMHKEAPVVIEDDACLWRSVLSPGVTVGRKTVLLPGAVLTKDAPPDSCFGGVPAVDLSDRVKPYRNVPMEEKFQMMREFIAEFLAKHYPGRYAQVGVDEHIVKSGKRESFRLLLKQEVEDENIRDGETALIVGTKDSTTRSSPGVSVFDISSRTYTKWLSDPEVKFMWFLLDSRAKFSPAAPKVTRRERTGERGPYNNSLETSHLMHLRRQQVLIAVKKWFSIA
jgi:acetyltransferase-like isoleucine patch superfamily enzyme